MLLALVLVTGCFAPTTQHESLDPVLMFAEGVNDFVAAQDLRPADHPTNGCLPIDYYVGGASFLIRKVSDGCEWISYSETGRELGHGKVALAK